MIEAIQQGCAAKTEGSKVLVTGATGFLAGHVIEQLINKNYHVRGTVRSTKDQSKLQWLNSLDPDHKRLELVEADLLKPESFVGACQGVDFVLHTASPYVLTVKDAQKELVDPAVNGTLAVLNACLNSPSIRKVIITSSIAAVTDEPVTGHVYTEADWNTTSSLTRNAYYYSKVQAERAAWAWMTEKKPHFKLAVINPFLIIGPQRGVTALNESNKLLVDLLSGKYPGIMQLSWGLVDVRDVAAAHILAMENPAADGRYLTCAGTKPMKEVAELIKAKYPQSKAPTLNLACGVGNLLVKVGSAFEEKGVRDYLSSNLGSEHVPTIDSSKVKALGLNFRDIDKSVIDTCEWIIAAGYVPFLAPKKDE